MSFQFHIAQQWDGTPLRDADRAEVVVLNNGEHLRIGFTARLLPKWTAPKTPVGFTDGLWEYDVFEIFFARPDGSYLEIEVGPAGHFLVYEFASYRKASDTNPRPLVYTWSVEDGQWSGEFTVPLEWLRVPINDCRVNAYQILTTAQGRQYLAWRSIPEIEPDFHRTECFAHLPL